LEQRNGRSARPREIAEWLGVDLEVVIEGLAAQGVGRPDSLDAPAQEMEGWNGRLRFGGALGLYEREFDLVEYREALAPLLAALRAGTADPRYKRWSEWLARRRGRRQLRGRGRRRSARPRTC
jgi:hypothetical protein